MCDVCGCCFVPKFYCPEEGAAHGHIFESENLYIDNLAGIYAFCPEHTFTSYDIVTAAQRHGWLSMDWLVHYWRRFASGVLFRLALAFEGVKRRLYSVLQRGAQ